MNQQGTSLTQIAEQYGLSTQTLRRRIEQHDELGIKLIPRKRTLLDPNQTAALCAILDQLYRSDEGDLAEDDTEDIRSAIETDRTASDFPVSTPVYEESSVRTFPADLDAALRRIVELEHENAELTAEAQRLQTDAAVANARAEERGTYLAALERRADAYPKLLQEGRDEARAAGLLEGKEQGREAGVSEERARWEQMGRWERFFARKR